MLLSLAVLGTAALSLAALNVVVLRDLVSSGNGALYLALLIIADVVIFVAFGAYKLQGLVISPLEGVVDAVEAIANGDLSRRVALEAYPGLLARELIGRRSYKSDEKAKQTPDRLIARKDLVTALEIGGTRLGLRLKLSHAQRDALVEDASGDSLDAVLCLLQAAWAQQQGAPRYGLPETLDPLEGWIVTA
jgi:hypothetical protein